MSNKNTIFDEYFANQDTVPSLHSNFSSIQLDILEIFDKLSNLDSTTPKYKSLIETLQIKQVLLENILEELTDWINLDFIEGEKYLEDKYDINNKTIKFLLEHKKRKSSDPSINPNPRI